MEDLLPSRVRECGTQPHAHWLFDIVIRRKGNADGGVLACQPSQERAGNETLTVLRFRKPIGVLRARSFSKELRRSCLLGTRQNAATPWTIPSRDSSESDSQLESLILAQNERWRQA
jgi:hypothetical protein